MPMYDLSIELHFSWIDLEVPFNVDLDDEWQDTQLEIWCVKTKQKFPYFGIVDTLEDYMLFLLVLVPLVYTIFVVSEVQRLFIHITKNCWQHI